MGEMILIFEFTWLIFEGEGDENYEVSVKSYLICYG